MNSTLRAALTIVAGIIFPLAIAALGSGCDGGSEPNPEPTPKPVSAVGDYELVVCIEDAGDEPIYTKIESVGSGGSITRFVDTSRFGNPQCVTIPPYFFSGVDAQGVNGVHLVLTFPDQQDKLVGKNVRVFSENHCPGQLSILELGAIEADRAVRLPTIRPINEGDLILWPRIDPNRSLLGKLTGKDI